MPDQPMSPRFTWLVYGPDDPLGNRLTSFTVAADSLTVAGDGSLCFSTRDGNPPEDEPLYGPAYILTAIVPPHSFSRVVLLFSAATWEPATWELAP